MMFQLKGYIPHCLNPAIIFTGVGTFNQARGKRDESSVC